jgi:hypothetical protein
MAVFAKGQDLRPYGEFPAAALKYISRLEGVLSSHMILILLLESIAILGYCDEPEL